MVLLGAERSEAARAQGVDTQTLRDWIVLYNEGGVEGLRPVRRGGRRCRLSASQLERVAGWVDAGPEAGADASSRLRLRDIRERIAAVFSLRYSLEEVRKLLRHLGFRHISPRPLHPKADLAAQEDFRRNFSQLAATAADGAGPIEIWFQDEARAGQQGMLSRVWAGKGSWPRIPRDRRFGTCYLFSAACPERKRAVGHVCSRANSVEMNRHLGDISAAVEPGSHAVVVLDGAGWHKSRDLDIPTNLSLLHLPPYSPELNPMENVFEYLKSNHLANRVFKTENASSSAAQPAKAFPQSFAAQAPDCQVPFASSTRPSERHCRRPPDKPLASELSGQPQKWRCSATARNPQRKPLKIRDFKDQGVEDQFGQRQMTDESRTEPDAVTHERIELTAATPSHSR